jgi:hypothetical protein
VNGLGCAAVRDAAPEMALGILDGAERAEVLLHLVGCPRCQRYVEDLAGVADGLARLAPEVEPPRGFAQRVDAQVRGARFRTRRRWVASVAAAAAAAAILAVVGVRLTESGSSQPAAAPALHASTMVGDGGTWVGSVAMTRTDPSSMVVSVSYSVPDGTYALELASGSTTRRVGSITIRHGHGGWVGTTTVPDHGNSSLNLVAADGSTVCHAPLRGSWAT